jgi:hypothetical protein
MKPVYGDLLYFACRRIGLCPIEHNIDSQITLRWMKTNKSPLAGYMDGILFPFDCIPPDGIQKTKKGFAKIFDGVHGISVVGVYTLRQRLAISF